MLKLVRKALVSSFVPTDINLAYYGNIQERRVFSQTNVCKTFSTFKLTLKNISKHPSMTLFLNLKQKARNAVKDLKIESPDLFYLVF